MRTKDDGGAYHPIHPKLLEAMGDLIEGSNLSNKAKAKATDQLTDKAMGASLRDHFAGLAMQGLLAQSVGTAMGSDPKHAANYAYAMADAMLAERSKP